MCTSPECNNTKNVDIVENNYVCMWYNVRNCIKLFKLQRCRKSQYGN